MGVFKTTAGYLKFPLPEAIMKKIDRMVEKENKILLP